MQSFEQLYSINNEEFGHLGKGNWDSELQLLHQNILFCCFTFRLQSWHEI